MSSTMRVRVSSDSISFTYTCGRPSWTATHFDACPAPPPRTTLASGRFRPNTMSMLPMIATTSETRWPLQRIGKALQIGKRRCRRTWHRRGLFDPVAYRVYVELAGAATRLPRTPRRLEGAGLP